MPNQTGEILADICEVLHGTGLFAGVTLGPDRDAARWPRAEVMFLSVDQVLADDSHGGHWFTLKARAHVYARSAEEGSTLQRALELANAAQSALLIDRFRNQRCRDLPVGSATDLGPVRVDPPLRPPHVALAFEIRCHFESEGDA